MIRQLGEKFPETRLVHVEVDVNINIVTVSYNYLNSPSLLFAHLAFIEYRQALVEYPVLQKRPLFRFLGDAHDVGLLL